MKTIFFLSFLFFAGCIFEDEEPSDMPPVPTPPPVMNDTMKMISMVPEVYVSPSTPAESLQTIKKLRKTSSQQTFITRFGYYKRFYRPDGNSQQYTLETNDIHNGELQITHLFNESSAFPGNVVAKNILIMMELRNLKERVVIETCVGATYWLESMWLHSPAMESLIWKEYGSVLRFQWGVPSVIGVPNKKYGLWMCATFKQDVQSRFLLVTESAVYKYSDSWKAFENVFLNGFIGGAEDFKVSLIDNVWMGSPQ